MEKRLEGGAGAPSERGFVKKKVLGTLWSTVLSLIELQTGSASKKTDLSNDTSRKIKLKEVSMKEEMKDEAISLAIEALEKYTDELTAIASHIRRHFEKKHGGCWECIVGDSFGIDAYCNRSIHFRVDALEVFLFQPMPSPM